ncbi:carbohydrate porin [Legionella tunisiensis]|uniref:carbohydrate porin n=1 Tax=Legionella tunisiensis TaxID=1034944 RepID=UPI0002EAD658|nr:carbohydrate porin [Legionella tunisiensis]
MDGESALRLPGSTFGSQFLQFNGANTNYGTGAVQSFNSTSAGAPFNRSELYQLWYLQRLFNEKLALRVGKLVATYDFNNVLRTTPFYNTAFNISSLSGLIYAPIFVNSSMLGVLPSYYNSAYGLTANYTPNKSFYFSGGFMMVIKLMAHKRVLQGHILTDIIFTLLKQVYIGLRVNIINPETSV